MLGCDNRSSVARILAFGLLLLAIPALLLLLPPAARAQGAAPAQLTGLRGGIEVAVPLNKSHILEVDQQIGELSVGNPEIADVVPLTTRSVYILGRALGTTNLTITDANNNVMAVVDIVVTFDIASLQQRLGELAPGDEVTISPAADALILSGTVSSQAQLQRILAIADRYAPQRVTNLMSVGGSQQVLLKVRFAEVQRSVMRNVGATFDVTVDAGDDFYALFSGQGINPESFGVLGGSIIGGDVTVDATIDALEQRGFIRTLAEPNIIALSGDTANLLAGGEFPIPVAQNTDEGGQTITIQFKQFGVGLSFTPTIIGRETVNLVLSTEVSAIDETLRVTAGGVSVPGLKVRRTNTTIELQDGQSFAISGLTQDNFSDAINKFPLLGDLPILGALFRSPDFQRQQTELVVIVTMHLVQPVNRGILVSPTDAAPPPTEHGLFFEGATEPLPAPAGAQGQGGFVVP